jgi:hypothetical protein
VVSSIPCRGIPLKHKVSHCQNDYSQSRGFYTGGCSRISKCLDIIGDESLIGQITSRTMGIRNIRKDFTVCCPRRLMFSMSRSRLQRTYRAVPAPRSSVFLRKYASAWLIKTVVLLPRLAAVHLMDGDRSDLSAGCRRLHIKLLEGGFDARPTFTWSELAL